MKKILLNPQYRIVVLAVVLAALAGIIAAAITTSSLVQYQSELVQQIKPLLINNDSLRAYPASFAEASQKFVENIMPAIASVYPKIPKGNLGYSNNESVGSAAVLTSDGWIMIGSQITENILQQSDVLINGKIYSVDQTTIDPLTHIVFGKISANNLSVIDFGRALDMTLGQQLFVVGFDKSLLTTSVIKQEWVRGKLVSSDHPARRVRLDLNKKISNPLVFDLTGSLVGIIESQNEISSIMIPVDYFSGAFKTLLEKKIISRPTFGVQYIDITHSIGLPEKIKRSNETGAYLTGSPAVQKGSPAAISGFVDGDILLSINDQPIGEKRGLDELIMSYKPGDKISVSFDRAGEKKTATVVLGETGK